MSEFVYDIYDMKRFPNLYTIRYYYNYIIQDKRLWTKEYLGEFLVPHNLLSIPEFEDITHLSYAKEFPELAPTTTTIKPTTTTTTTVKPVATTVKPTTTTTTVKSTITVKPIITTMKPVKETTTTTIKV